MWIYATLFLLLGMLFVEVTYRLHRNLGLYLIAMPLKLFLFNLAFYYCYVEGMGHSVVYCLLGFVIGFFIAVLLRGFWFYGRPEGS
jgi:hypothetical protein